MDVPLILLAAGRSTRFGSLKQVAPVGPGGASILAYSVVDALLAGFSRVVLVVRPEIEGTIRDHLEQHLGAGLPVQFVHQAEPLGTAHAALVALAGVDGPAAIANGDDAYGREAFAQLRRSADPMRASEPASCALVAYSIAGTLSKHGGVSRGWVQTDGDAVTSVDEIYEVRAGRSAGLAGRSGDGEPVVLPPDALGSMNLWMLGPGTRPLLARAFARHDRQPGEEFALSTVLNRLRHVGALSIRFAGTAEGWFGVTFAEDLPGAAARMAAAHETGRYTEPLAEMVDPFRSAK